MATASQASPTKISLGTKPDAHQENLLKGRQSGYLTNVDVICPKALPDQSGEPNSVFKAHRFILATQSAFFEAMLTRGDKNNGGFNEAKNGRIDIGDFGDDIVEAMLQYMYSGYCEIDATSLANLFAASNKYQLPELMMACEEQLCERLTIENVVDIALLADRFRAAKIREAAIDFICETMRASVQTEACLRNWMAMRSCSRTRAIRPSRPCRRVMNCNRSRCTAAAPFVKSACQLSHRSFQNWPVVIASTFISSATTWPSA